MMRYWLQSSAKSYMMGPSATLSLVAHVALIGAAVRETAINARELAESIEQRVAYLPPPDRRGDTQTVVEHIQYFDIGGGAPVLPVATGDPRLQGGPQPDLRAGTESGRDPDTQEKSVADPDRDSVYSVLEVEERAVRTSNSAAPAYPTQLMKDGTEGAVLVRFVVDTTGRADPGTFEVVRATHTAFAAAVRAAVPEMIFIPAIVAGRRVRQTVEQNFEFRITNPTPVAAEHTRTKTRRVP